MMQTIGGDEVWLYPKDPNDTNIMLKGCIVIRGRYPWSHEQERRDVCEWYPNGMYIFANGNINHPYNLVMEKEETNVEENRGRPRSFWRSLWDRWVRA